MGLILWWPWHLVVFLELWQDSGVRRGTQGASRVAKGSPFSNRVAKGSWGLLSSHCRAHRPHLVLCPETPCSSPGATGILGLHLRLTRGVRPRLKWKQRTLLTSRVATGTSWSPLSGLKGVKLPVEFWEADLGLLSRPCRKRRASFRDDGGISWFLSSCGTMCGVSLELWLGTQGASRVAPGKSSLHSICEGERSIALESRQGNRTSRFLEGGISRSFSSCSRKPWVPLTCFGDPTELLMAPMGSQVYCGVGMGLPELHWVWCNGTGPHLKLRWEPQGYSPVLACLDSCSGCDRLLFDYLEPTVPNL